MVNSIIVTVTGNYGTDEFDVELPCNILISDLKKQMLEIPELTHGCKQVRIYMGKKELRDNTSLAENGIWDGAYLTIKSGG